MTILDQPLISFGRAITGDLDAGLRREWLVTNGLGGYASGTLSGIATRAYHGLLVAALEPPVARTVLVGGMVEWATCDGHRYGLSAQEYGDGTIDSNGYVNLESFALEGTLPVWNFAFGDALLQRRLWLDHGSNTTHITFTLLRGSRSLHLELTPLVTYRDFHSLTSGQGWQPAIEPIMNGATVRARDGATPFHLLVQNGQFQPGGDWFWNLHYREETARGLADRGDLFAAGSVMADLAVGETCHLVFTTEDLARVGSTTADASLAAERQRQLALLQRANAEREEPTVQQLVLAADQFLVRRDVSGQPPGKTVIAGYHWFNDWGRDTMISLPGLTLATGRAEDAAGILRTFARYVDQGLLPNNFPDRSGAIPGYNTVDATLWYILAVRAYHHATGDDQLVADLLPTLRDIIAHHQSGTRYGIGVDPADGLLHAGESGVQLTWMDAKIGDWVVTPRIGKPVEINALWYNALLTVTEFLASRDATAANDLEAAATQARESFRQRFRHREHDSLADVVDGPDGDDWTLRPNQIFAVSLPYPLLNGDEARAIVESTGRALLTSYGLRSLSPDHPDYRADYGGDQLKRDGGYHQGPVWSWLIGAYVEALLRVTGDHTQARSALAPLTEHLADAGLGSISEILEGGPPHLPRGCVAQAWSVAEALRAWRFVSASGATGHLD